MHNYLKPCLWEDFGIRIVSLIEMGINLDCRIMLEHCTGTTGPILHPSSWISPVTSQCMLHSSFTLVVSRVVAGAWTSLLHLLQQLSTQRQHYSNPYPVPSFEWATTRGGSEGKSMFLFHLVKQPKRRSSRAHTGLWVGESRWRGGGQDCAALMVPVWWSSMIWQSGFVPNSICQSADNCSRGGD